MPGEARGRKGTESQEGVTEDRGQKMPEKESNCSKIHFSERRDSEEIHRKSYFYPGHHKCHVRRTCY